MKSITEIQSVILGEIQEFYIENLYPPTIQEIADIMGYTKPNAYCHVIALRKKGMFQHASKLIPIGVKVVKNLTQSNHIVGCMSGDLHDNNRSHKPT